jgi:hypothetical protein
MGMSEDKERTFDAALAAHEAGDRLCAAAIRWENSHDDDALAELRAAAMAHAAPAIAAAEDRAGQFFAVLNQVVFLLERDDPGREGQHPTKSDRAVALSMAKSALAYDATRARGSE